MLPFAMQYFVKSQFLNLQANQAKNKMTESRTAAVRPIISDANKYTNRYRERAALLRTSEIKQVNYTISWKKGLNKN